MPVISDSFSALLGGFDLAALDAHDSSIIGVDGELRIGFLNAGWYRFAAENQGEPAISERWGLGRNLWDAIPTPLHEFFRNLFATAFALNQPDQLHPLLHDYECSSPEHYRRFTLSLYPLRGQKGLLLVHSLRVERPWGTEERKSATGSAYARQDGMLRQCANCRRVQMAGDEGQWHYVPEWSWSSPPNTSHGLCLICLDYYYPGSREA